MSRNRSTNATRALPLGLACLLLTAAAGCPQPKPEPDDGENRATILSGVTIELLVVDDPALARAAEELRGEWKTLTKGEFRVATISAEDLIGRGAVAADAIVAPSHLLGPLAESGRLAKVPQPLQPRQLAAGESDSWTDVFELLKLREAAWGNRLCAVPLGSPVLVCYYRTDLLKQIDRRPPGTWAEYRQLAGLLADRANLGDAAPPEDAPWCGALEPLAPGWAGLVLLARAAPYAKHRDNYSTLFNADTMDPLIAGPPFVRALAELVAAAGTAPIDPVQLDPAAVRDAFWSGRCALTLSWPTAAAGGVSDVAAKATLPVGFVELPGSTDVYDVATAAWDVRDADRDTRVPLLGIAGRLGLVSQTSEHSRAAWELLLWLAGEKYGRRFSAASDATTLFRRAHLDRARSWVEPPAAPAAERYARQTAETLGRQQWLFAPRIPGRGEYLAALDEAVARAVRGQATPEEALAEAATRWSEITEQIGRDRQKQAYWASLGLD